MKKKYEEIYNKFKNGENDKRLEELKAKIENKTANQAEYKEAKRIEKAKQNISKVDNIIKLQDRLNEEAEKIQEGIFKRENEVAFVEELDKSAEKLEEELAKLEEEKENITKELKTATGDEKAVLTVKLNDINSKIGKNNEKYQKNLQERLAIQNKDDSKDKYATMSLEELKEQYSEFKNKASKCNLAIINLLKGRDWNDIQQKLDNYQNREFTCKKKDTKKKETTKEISDEELQKIEKNLRKENEKIFRRAKKDEDFKTKEDVDETALTETSTFAEKHPRLAKIGNWFKNIFSKTKNKIESVTKSSEKIENNELEEQKSANNKSIDRTVEEIINSNENNFKKYLKDISEKGYDEYIKETTDSRTSEKLKEAKRQAAERETQKFGKEYAEKSFKEEEKER